MLKEATALMKKNLIDLRKYIAPLRLYKSYKTWYGTFQAPSHEQVKRRNSLPNTDLHACYEKSYTTTA